MTIANDADRTAPPPTADGASSNGSATLRDRVRSLRLSEPGAGGKGASFAAVALPWGLCLILAGVTAAFGYYAYAVAPTHAADAKASDDAAQKTPKDGSPAAVTSDVASSGDVALEAKGYIIPVHQIQVSPKVSGMLIDIDPRLEEGQRFKEGDVLAKIEDVDYRTTYMHAERACAAAQKRKEQSIANLASGRATLAGKEDAFARNVNAPSGVAPRTSFFPRRIGTPRSPR